MRQKQKKIVSPITDQYLMIAFGGETYRKFVQKIWGHEPANVSKINKENAIKRNAKDKHKRRHHCKAFETCELTDDEKKRLAEFHGLDMNVGDLYIK